jgi:hypothetical protein
LDKDCYRFLVFDYFIENGVDGSRRTGGSIYYGLCDCGIPRFARGADGELKLASFGSSGENCSAPERLGLVQLRPLDGALGFVPRRPRDLVKVYKERL